MSKCILGHASHAPPAGYAWCHQSVQYARNGEFSIIIPGNPHSTSVQHATKQTGSHVNVSFPAFLAVTCPSG